ncbi:hypothetical protein ACA910_019080 [Epithemia clementina (nom. ined.)]
MESLLEALEENRLDALYLFITDVLRDATAFRRYFANLLSVLPQNYSVHRIEAGHEFLKQIVDSESDQRRLFRTITELESLRTLIISDGYVQRKDCGAVITNVLLQELPRATSLVNLDIHRMQLSSPEEIELLSLACESMAESLEELRLTGLFLTGSKTNTKGALDPVVEVLHGFQHLRSLTLALYPNALENEPEHNDNNNAGAAAAANNNDPAATNNNSTNNNKKTNKPLAVVSPRLWYTLLSELSTLQDLTLRHMQLDDDACHSMSQALQREDLSFLSSLDLRKNTPGITADGYASIARALELNFSSWCSVAVDDPRQQSVFHVLIEMNQHNRGDVVRNLHLTNLAQFLQELRHDPTAIWHFLRIHDGIRNPLAAYLEFQTKTNLRNQQLQQNQQQQQQERKRKAEQLLSTIETE